MNFVGRLRLEQKNKRIMEADATKKLDKSRKRSVKKLKGEMFLNGTKGVIIFKIIYTNIVHV